MLPDFVILYLEIERDAIYDIWYECKYILYHKWIQMRRQMWKAGSCQLVFRSDTCDKNRGPQDMQKRMASTFGSIAESQVTVDTTITSIISEVQESTWNGPTVFGESQGSKLSPMERPWNRRGVCSRSRRDCKKENQGLDKFDELFCCNQFLWIGC